MLKFASRVNRQINAFHRKSLLITKRSFVETLKDEYGAMDSSGETCTIENFKLESGIVLPKVDIRYRAYGELNEKKDNTMIICHALTGNASIESWWGEMLGENKPFDPKKYYIICANILGSCYGSTGPTSINPKTGKKYGGEWPIISVRDNVIANHKILEEKGINKINCVIGGSLGGMQTLEWLLLYGKNEIKKGIILSCGAYHTPWQIGWNECQRDAIMNDINYNNGNYYENNKKPFDGLSLARKIAMITYRSYTGYHNKFELDNEERNVQTYLKYQGEKFNSRFDSNSYIALTRMMDTHNVGRNRGGYIKALESISNKCLILGVNSDMLYPISEQKELHKYIKNSEFVTIKSIEGHDGFLLEQDQISKAMLKFLNE